MGTGGTGFLAAFVAARFQRAEGAADTLETCRHKSRRNCLLTRWGRVAPASWRHLWQDVSNVLKVPPTRWKRVATRAGEIVCSLNGDGWHRLPGGICGKTFPTC